jgi:SanA protein
MRRSRRAIALRSVAIAIPIAFLLGAASLVAGQLLVSHAARPFTFAGLDEVPARDVAVVPGVGSARPGRPPRNLVERLRVALALYRAHKVKTILVSGVSDDSVRGHDEVVEMRRWLASRGVATEDVLVDPAGYRTLDTMWRAANLLHVSSAIICTQATNVTRAIFLARKEGIDAVGLIAPARTPASARAWRVDALKTVLAVIDTYVLHRKPQVTNANGIVDGRRADGPLVAAQARSSGS